MNMKSKEKDHLDSIQIISFISGDNTLVKYFILFFISLFGYFFVYGYELSHFTLSIDEEPRSNYLHTIAVGRWGDALLKRYFLPEPYIPFFSQMLAFIVMSITAVFVCRLLKFNATQSFLFVIMMIAMPQLAFQLQYTQQVDSYAIGCLFAVMSTLHLFFERKKIFFFLFCVTYTSISIAIYQSLILIPFTMFLFYAYRENFDLVTLLRKAFTLILITVIGILLYAAITVFFLKYYNVNDMGYFSSRINWLHYPMSTVLIDTIKNVSGYLFGNSIYGLETYVIAVFFFLHLSLKSIVRKKFFLPFVLLSVLISPFLLMIFIGNFQPPRALSSLPFCFAFLSAQSLSKLNVKFSASISFLLILIASAKCNSLFYAEQLRHEQDVSYATRLLSKIYASCPDFNEERDYIYFFGSPNLAGAISFDKNVDSFNQSWFNLFNGNNERIINFMKAAGLANFKIPYKDMSVIVQYQIKDMQTYPQSGSIKCFGENTVIVKLGKDPGIIY